MSTSLQTTAAITALLLSALVAGGLPLAEADAQMAAAPVVHQQYEPAFADAVRAEFGASDVRVEFANIDVLASAPLQRELAGQGRLAIDGSGWIPFRMAALYDVQGGQVVLQSLRIGDGKALEVAADVALSHALEGEAGRLLQAEFAGQAVKLVIAGAETTRVGNDLLQVQATGRADFGSEGVAATTVQALYSPRTGEWLRVHYRLGTDGMGTPVAGL